MATRRGGCYWDAWAHRASRLEEGDGVIPANMAVSARELAEVDEVRAASEQDVLGVDDFVERRMKIRVGTTTDKRFALQQRDVCACAGERDGGGETGGSCADDEDVESGLLGHPTSLALKDWRMPMARMLSF